VVLQPRSTRKSKARPPPGRALVPKYRSTGTRTVWLTFDDGPHKSHTGKILGVLEQHKITATFFVVGKHCRLCPDVLEKVSAAGHRIANHTYSHPDLTKLSPAEVKAEIKQTETLIARYVKGPKLFRPPYGAHNSAIDRVIREMGYRLVFWNVDTVDWNKDYKPKKWVAHGVNQIRSRSSSVVLNHDIHRTTADHLNEFIVKIRALGNVRFGAPSDL
jgi:peptidoglycan-N-acetylglucosamine deacetylase